MTVIETSSTSWFSRLGSSFKQCVSGLILFVIAIPFLFWNEGRAVKTYNSLKEGQAAVISVANETVDFANEGRLIHITGKANTEDVLQDSTFNVEVNAIRLIRTVQMYQWSETKKTEKRKKVGGGEEKITKYEYSCDWSSQLISSDEFKERSGHLNPTSMPYPSSSWTANKVNMGEFVLPADVVSQIDISERLTPPAQNESIDAQVTQSGYLYFGKSEATPQVGDVRISFRAIKPQDISVIAAQLKNTLTPYQTKAGRALLIVDNGIHSSDEMFAKELQSNKMITWIIRIVGFLMMLFGLQMLLSPLVTMADVLPFLGNLLEMGTFIVAFCVALATWCVVVAVAWLFYRPLLSISLLAVTIGLFVYLRGQKNKKRSNTSENSNAKSENSNAEDAKQETPKQESNSDTEQK